MWPMNLPPLFLTVFIMFLFSPLFLELLCLCTLCISLFFKQRIQPLISILSSLISLRMWLNVTNFLMLCLNLKSDSIKDGRKLAPNSSHYQKDTNGNFFLNKLSRLIVTTEKYQYGCLSRLNSVWFEVSWLSSGHLLLEMSLAAAICSHPSRMKRCDWSIGTLYPKPWTSSIRKISFLHRVKVTTDNISKVLRNTLWQYIQWYQAQLGESWISQMK
jgi:hypothetical protein